MHTTCHQWSKNVKRGQLYGEIYLLHQENQIRVISQPQRELSSSYFNPKIKSNPS